jgi:nucleoside 2-deoxyribosyltransferase
MDGSPGTVEAREARRRMIYLACPYSHPDIATVKARFEAANCAAARLIGAGEIVFSPISMTHPIAMVMGNHLSADWYAFDEAFMERCDGMAVLLLDGWEESLGVAREIAWFEARGLPIRYIDPETA